MAPRNKEDVFDEPWMQPPPERPITGPPPLPGKHAIPDEYDTTPLHETEMEQVLHSINHEPQSLEEADPRETELDRLIKHHRTGMSPLALVAVVLLVAILAGPVSVLGTMAAGQRGSTGILYLVAGGPVIEEMMKLGGLLFLLEKKPWYILRGWHIIVAACVSAILFGVIENLVYSGIYLRNVNSISHETVMTFRWSVTVVLHTATTFVGAMGLRKAWQSTIAKGRLFDSQIAEPYIAAAVVIHGSYNALALLFNHYLVKF